MVAGRYPKDESSRRNRNEPTFDWVVLPFDGREGDAPELPGDREFTKWTEKAWQSLWSRPQAVMWDQSGFTLHRWAVLHHQLLLDDEKVETAKSKAASISAEMRQIEDRHGLSPKAMLQLRWKIASAPEVDENGEPASVTHLQSVPDPEPEPEVEPEAKRPALKAGKPAWIDWAISCGADPDHASSMTVPALIESYRDATPGAPRTPVRSAAADKLRDRMKGRR